MARNRLPKPERSLAEVGRNLCAWRVANNGHMTLGIDFTWRNPDVASATMALVHLHRMARREAALRPLTSILGSASLAHAVSQATYLRERLGPAPLEHLAGILDATVTQPNAMEAHEPRAVAEALLRSRRNEEIGRFHKMADLDERDIVAVETAIDTALGDGQFFSSLAVVWELAVGPHSPLHLVLAAEDLLDAAGVVDTSFLGSSVDAPLRLSVCGRVNTLLANRAAA